MKRFLWLRFGTWCFAVIAFLCCFFSMQPIRDLVAFQHANATEAYFASSPAPSTTTRRGYFRFETRDAPSAEVDVFVPSSRAVTFERGDVVRIRFVGHSSQAAPARALLDDDATMFWVAATFVVLGLLSALSAVGLVRISSLDKVNAVERPGFRIVSLLLLGILTFPALIMFALFMGARPDHVRLIVVALSLALLWMKWRGGRGPKGPAAARTDGQLAENRAPQTKVGIQRLRATMRSNSATPAVDKAKN
jgi:hypothetical protein